MLLHEAREMISFWLKIILSQMILYWMPDNKANLRHRFQSNMTTPINQQHSNSLSKLVDCPVNMLHSRSMFSFLKKQKTWWDKGAGADYFSLTSGSYIYIPVVVNLRGLLFPQRCCRGENVWPFRLFIPINNNKKPHIARFQETWSCPGWR